MRLILFFLFTTLFVGLACKSAQKTTKPTEMADSKPVITISQGIRGLVTQVIGNQMPSPNTNKEARKKTGGSPYPTTVFFYEPTTLNQVNRMEYAPLFISINTKMIASVTTDSAGAFIAALPVGTYSVFVQVGNRFFANSYDIRNNILLVDVVKDKLSEMKIVVNNDAAY